MEPNGLKRLEQLFRYISRPALSHERVQLNAARKMVQELWSPGLAVA